MHRLAVPLVLACALASAATAQEPDLLFDRVADTLAERYFDRAFRRDTLPALVAKFRPAAAAAQTLAEERGVVHALLAAVPASHLALLSEETHERLEAELMARRTPMLGCGLLGRAGRFYVDFVYEGSPAAASGLPVGAEILAIDGVAPGRSGRLDWRSDDAHLPDGPTHDLLVDAGDEVTLTVATTDGPRDVAVRAARYSAFQASVASAQVVAAGGHRLLYVHLWFVFHARSGALVRRALAEHPDAEGLVLDLRGRGGSALECKAVVRAVADAGERGVPTAALVDGRTRSAKEMIADELATSGLALLVGEHTAGAVLPASFVRLGDGAVLMLPVSRLGGRADRIEGHGVEPTVRVAAAGPGDPILAAGLAALAEALDSAKVR